MTQCIIPLENHIEDIYRHTTREWADKELEELDTIAGELRNLFRRVCRRLEEDEDDARPRL